MFRWFITIPPKQPRYITLLPHIVYHFAVSKSLPRPKNQTGFRRPTNIVRQEAWSPELTAVAQELQYLADFIMLKTAPKERKARKVVSLGASAGSKEVKKKKEREKAYPTPKEEKKGYVSNRGVEWRKEKVLYASPNTPCARRPCLGI